MPIGSIGRRIICHYRPIEYKRLYEDRAHEDLPEWAKGDETDEETESEDAENPFAPAEAD